MSTAASFGRSWPDRPRGLRRLVAILAAISASSAFGADDPADATFRDKVAPILTTRCLRCHGESAKKGGLSLTSADALRAGGDGGAAVEPGKPEESLLIEKVGGDPPEMPKGAKPLSAEEVATLKAWVEAGARWPEGLSLKEPKADAGPWWAIQPLNRPTLPVVQQQNWARTPIDAYILSALESRNLSPRPEADRRTLIRRLTFDLHGLPPTPEEIDAFLADDRPDAYERLVDHLLASPRYGERWGRHWLDLVHYGDSHGYDKDKRRDHAWPYRDYAIRALNADIPYGKFVLEQLAGDVLFPERADATVATGFIAAGPWDFVGNAELREGTVEKEKTRLIDRDDMVTNAMSTFVSLTVHCARCHDHKFDPIPQRDYYRLQAVFAGVERGDRAYLRPETAARRLPLQRQKEAETAHAESLARKIAAASSPELTRLDEDVKALRQRLADAPKPASTIPSPKNGYHSGIHPNPEGTSWVQIDLGRPLPIDEIRLVPARPTDFPDTPGFGFPKKMRVEVGDDPEFAKGEVVSNEEREDDAVQPDEPYVIRPGGRSTRFVRITATRLWKRLDDFVFALGEVEIFSAGRNVAAGAKVTSLDSIEGGRWGRAALVDGFDSRSRRPDARDAAENRRSDLLFQLRMATRDRERLADAVVDRKLHAELAQARLSIEVADIALKEDAPPDKVYAVLSRPPKSIHLLNRGEVEQKREAVEPGALACVPGLESSFSSGDEGQRRAALARWVADPKNVLTWRSIVNRVWQHHFGRGLVETPSDFGRNGSSPTHPELLDWLATEFLARGQSLKALHRLILTSAVYRQSSAHDEAAARIDAENRFFWRMNRRRLDAESIRDATLSVSGRLDPRMGGPAYEPFRFKDDHSPIYDHEALDRIDAPETRRRTIYRFAVRSVPDPFLDSLDCADPNTNVPIRNTTLTAPQALALLNDPFMIKESAAFGRRVVADGKEMEVAIGRAFRLALGRRPEPEESRALSAYAKEHGLANACRVLLNMNEFVFVD